MGRGRVESARRSLQKRRRAFPPSDRFILHRVVSGRTEIHRSCPLPHHQTRAGSHRHARPGVPGERGWGIARVARNRGWQRQSRGKDALFFSVTLPASHLAVPCHHGRWAGDGWGGACSRAHRARSDGADPVQQRYPRRRRLAWLDWPQEQVSGREMGEVLGAIRPKTTHPIRRRSTRRGKCCLSSKTPRIAAAASGPNGRAILGAYDMKGGRGGGLEIPTIARAQELRSALSIIPRYTPHSTTEAEMADDRLAATDARHKANAL